MSYKFKKVVYTGGLKLWPHSPDHLGIEQGFKMLGVDAYLLDDVVDYDTPKKLADVILKINPDLVVYGETRPIGRKVPLILKGKVKAPQVFWMLDYRRRDIDDEDSYHGGWNKWKECGPGLDYIILSNKGQLDWWSEGFGCPAAFLPHACWIPDRLVYDKKYAYPAVFVGNKVGGNFGFKDRLNLLNEIKELIDFEWINSSNTEERNKIWDAMPAIYHSSDAVLDISHFWSNPGYCSGRYWYVNTLGGASITKRFPDCEELFPEGTKRYFETAEEAAKLIKYYQKHPRKRMELKIKGAEYAWTHHNYAVRFQQLFDILNGEDYDIRG